MNASSNPQLAASLGHQWECPHAFTMGQWGFMIMGVEPGNNAYNRTSAWLSGTVVNGNTLDISSGSTGLSDHGNLYAITHFT